MAPTVGSCFCGTVVILFSTLAFLFGAIGMFYCNTVQFPQKDGDGEIAAGLFGYRTKAFYTVSGDNTIYYSDTCVSYNVLSDDGFDYSTDKKTNVMQRLAISVAVIGGVFVVASCFVPCLPAVPAKAWKCVGLMFFLVCILQGCTLILMDSSICTNNPLVQYLEEEATQAWSTLEEPTKCESSVGFNLIITATVFWFVAGAIPLFSPVPTMDDANEVVETPAVAAEPDLEAKNAPPEQKLEE